jgi:hypothetical protein
MIRSGLPTALACLVLATAPLSAADLAQVDRTIAREPAYRSKPKYCLLVFGREAQTRVWLVLAHNRKDRPADRVYGLSTSGNGRVLLWDLTKPPLGWCGRQVKRA